MSTVFQIQLSNGYLVPQGEMTRSRMARLICMWRKNSSIEHGGKPYNVKREGLHKFTATVPDCYPFKIQVSWV